MLKLITSLAATVLMSSAWAQQPAAGTTMQEHDKTIEMCRSLKLKGDCTKMAMACHDKKDQAELKTCLTEQSKMKK